MQDVAPEKAIKQRLNDLKPGEDYIKSNRYLLIGTVDDADKLEFLKACERFDIPAERLPNFGRLSVYESPGRPGDATRYTNSPLALGRPLAFQPPAFDPLVDSHRTWAAKCQEEWRQFCAVELNSYLAKCTAARNYAVQVGLLRPRKAIRGDGPKRKVISIDHRYELAALHYCNGAGWKALTQIHRRYTQEQIRKSVTTILKNLNLKKRADGSAS